MKPISSENFVARFLGRRYGISAPYFRDIFAYFLLSVDTTNRLIYLDFFAEENLYYFQTNISDGHITTIVDVSIKKFIDQYFNLLAIIFFILLIGSFILIKYL